MPRRLEEILPKHFHPDEPGRIPFFLNISFTISDNPRSTTSVGPSAVQRKHRRYWSLTRNAVLTGSVSQLRVSLPDCREANAQEIQCLRSIKLSQLASCNAVHVGQSVCIFRSRIRSESLCTPEPPWSFFQAYKTLKRYTSNSAQPCKRVQEGAKFVLLNLEHTLKKPHPSPALLCEY